MDSWPALDASTAASGQDDPGCRLPAPLLVLVPHVEEGEVATLRRCAESAHCHVYAPTTGRTHSLVVGGRAEDLSLLRSLLVPMRGLALVRESIEAALGDRAAPSGLPRLDEGLYKQTEVVADTEVPRGTTLLVTREFLFDAAHNLPRYQGKCERLHGHTFRLQVTVKAPLDTWSGMAFDFHDLKRVVEARIISVLDHAYVNEVVPNPSAEFIAIWVWNRLQDLPLHEIKVWETPTCHVSYRGPAVAGA
jgi:6-pyruvoyltetrahydropterin/6-carboxytetrahydropterin synthase